MTELTTYTPGAMSAPVAAVPDYQTRAVQRLGEWVHSADAAYAVATRLVESSFVPQQFRNKPIEATAAILAGSEVGLSPMAALRAFDIIQGQAAARAITLRAIVQSFGHEIVLDESTATRCVMRGKRRGSTEWQKSVWTIDRAKDLGLTSKPNWKNQPATMLVARATSEIARLIASDAILGIGYSYEEIADGATGDPTGQPDPAPETSAASTTRRMSRPKPPAPEPDQPDPVTDEEAAVEVPDDQPESASRAQLTKIHAQFGDLDVTDRALRLEYVSRIVGRQVESSNDLTKDEASRLIEALDADIAAVQAGEA